MCPYPRDWTLCHDAGAILDHGDCRLIPCWPSHCVPATKLVRSLGKISCAAACCGMLRPAHVGTYTSMGADRQGRQADVVPNTFPIHQKSGDLCNNREELTGKTLPFPGMEPRTLQTDVWYINH